MPVQPEDVSFSPDALTPGTEVGTWRVLQRLGSGGMGTAYLVEDVNRPGELYVLKLPTHWDDGWAEREMRLLTERAVHPNVVRLHSWGRWPHPRTGHPYMIMDWVPGMAVHTWAETYNPPIREVIEKFATIALVLDDLHERGMLHRDLKPEHLIIREPDGRPVMIDFGVGWYEGAEPLTTQILAPGTPHLRSPESVHFWRIHHGNPGARYVYAPTDDLYALAVSAWRVLTGHWPFPPHLPRDILFAGIERTMPPLASEVNRRLPYAISEVLHRMLAKDPAQRYANGKELHMACVAALSFVGSAGGAEVFAWEAVPKTERKPGVSTQRIRRPEWPSNAPTPPRLQPAPADPEAAQQPPGGEPARSALPLPGEQVLKERRAWSRSVRLVLYAGLLGVGLVAMGALVRMRWGTPARTGENPAQNHPTSQVGQKSSYLAGQKLAGAPEWIESEQAAVPPSAELTPAAVVPPTTHLQDESAMNTTPATPKNDQPQQLTSTLSWAVGLATACATLACASAPVRHPPPPEECPPGAVEFMKQRDLARHDYDILIGNGDTPIQVREGPIEFSTGAEWPDDFNIGKAFGRIYFGADGRVHARVYEVESKTGQRYPFCAVLYDTGDFKRGVAVDHGEMTDTAWIVSDQGLHPVESFQ